MVVFVGMNIQLTLLQVWDTGVPVWSLILAVLLPVVYILPNGFIYAMTGQGVSVDSPFVRVCIRLTLTFRSR